MGNLGWFCKSFMPLVLEKLNPLLKVAIIAGVVPAVKMHIERGDSLNALDANGSRPLHLAALKGHVEIIRLLLEAGADQTIADSNGNTALEIAKSCGFNECYDLLSDNLKPLVIESADELPLDFEDDDVIAGAVDEWKPEEIQIAPAGDESLIDLAVAVNLDISTHQIINTDTSWDDLDLYLPESVSLKSEDKDWLARIKQLFGIAVSEGSVPLSLAEEICEDEYGAVDVQLLEKVLRVVHDLEAQTDERVGCTLLDWNHDNSESEEIVDEAVSRLENFSTNAADPMKQYIKDMRNRQLLNSEQEVTLGKEIEESTAEAMKILSRWPSGLRCLVWQYVPNEDLEVETDEEDDELEFDGLEDVLGVIDQPKRVQELLLSVGLSRGELLKLSMAMQEDRGELAGLFRASLASGENARNTMVASNLRLVLSVARQYAWSALPFEELIQAGNIGLMKGVDKWDWSRGFKLSTYATWWIKQSITREIADRESLIRVPVHLQEKLRKAMRDVRKSMKTVKPSHIAEEVAKRIGGSPERVERLLSIQNGPIPYDDEMFDQESSHSYMESSYEMDPARIYERNDTKIAIAKMLERLNERDRRIMAMRFGIDSDEPCTLEECGQAFGLTRERVRQVEAKAFKTLNTSGNRAVLANIYYT